MPVAHRILSTKKIGYHIPPASDPHELAAGVREGAHFEVQVASELYWRGSQNDYNLKSDFGPLRLPYPTTWMEWQIPSSVVLHGKAESNSHPAFVGSLLRERREGDEYVIEATSVFVDPKKSDALAYVSPVELSFRVDVDGRYIQAQQGVRCSYNDKGGLTTLEANRYREADMSHLSVACLAINLINCRNVTTEEAGTVQVSRSGAQKRRGEPQITYRTIRLPGPACGGEETGENVGIMPLHKVRGHFKTFTPDAPLLGRHTGTYWWGWQVRGKKSNGEVISDYELVSEAGEPVLVVY